MRALSTLIGVGLLAGATLISTDAEAGGLGVVVGGGTHSTPVTLYDGDNNLKAYRLHQMRPMTTLGFQMLLGDRDDRIVGVGRLYWTSDFPQVAGNLEQRAQDEGASSNLQYALISDYRNTGLATAGIQWGIWGDSTGGFSVNVLTSIGAGFMTVDTTEFLAWELGPGVQYAFSKRIQANAEVLYQGRYRKSSTHGVNATVGVRYLFD
ncbi:MAG: hypothetical protein VX899_15305 [Myxococcota bacterium]|nr:hypothetical protein [Myxococcota bacterium]